VKKGKLGFSRFYEVNLRLKAVGIWIPLAPFIGDQRILTIGCTSPIYQPSEVS
jgi:hypothetical protein